MLPQFNLENSKKSIIKSKFGLVLFLVYVLIFIIIIIHCLIQNSKSIIKVDSL